MDADHLTNLASHVGVHIGDTAAAHGMSGSRVFFAHRRDGRRCVLKVTSRDSSHRERAAERELAVYRTLADHLPVRMPALLDWHEDETGIAMLISAHGEIVPATSWDTKAWHALALDLAHLHATTIPDPERWRGAGTDLWAFRNPDLTMIDAFWRADLGDALDAIVDDREHLARVILAAGECLVHGDCHTENIPHEGRDLVWIDWQSTRIGNPALELAFPSVRAAPSGAVIPPDLLATYCDERGIGYDAMLRSVTAAELSIFIFEWPQYAGFNTPEENQRVRLRARHLADSWFGHASDG
jgi:aminoglycoside phosphotransferase (APT) family kinase protein